MGGLNVRRRFKREGVTLDELNHMSYDQLIALHYLSDYEYTIKNGKIVHYFVR
jgi:hypothetical protein